ncbi:MAG: hypothetical protein ACM3XO_24365 [Bacteroidota bacterium]
MQTLADLMSSPQGRQWLASKGVYTSQQQFREGLKAPEQSGLAVMLGVNGKKLICSGQQLYIDYHQSVLSKILTLREFKDDPDLFPFFLWVDTDRSGSDNLITKFAWPVDSKKGPIRITPAGIKDIESRFVQLDPMQLRGAIDKLGTHLRQSNVIRKSAKAKYQELRKFFDCESAGILSDFNYQVTYFLLNKQLGYGPSAVILSDAINQGLITGEVDLVINHLDEVIKVFNASVQSMLELGVDPQVEIRDQDYLPLFYSCNVDHQRLRLKHVVEGGDHFATCLCKCGESYRFYLGTNVLSISEISETRRWSPDVLMPAFFNDYVSGYVAGKSSALYLLIINDAIRQILDKTPVPILVPESLGRANSEPDQVDSLLYDYLNAET